MPYICQVCGKVYSEFSGELKEVMERGHCTCGKTFLMYQRPKNTVPQEAAKKAEAPKIAEKAENDLEWLDRRFSDRMKDDALKLDVETIRRIEEGKFEVDVPGLMGGKPVVIKAKDGVYYIDIARSMMSKKKKED